jgi:hypothetical protein
VQVSIDRSQIVAKALIVVSVLAILGTMSLPVLIK